MPRKKVNLNGQGTTEVLAIHGRIAQAARSFAQEILQILGSATLAELTAVSQGGGLLSSEQRAAYSRTIELKRLGGTRVVECPVQGCKQPGVRAKMNFCHDHFRSLSRPERVRLREAQKARTQNNASSSSEGQQEGESKPGPKGKRSQQVRAN